MINIILGSIILGIGFYLHMNYNFGIGLALIFIGIIINSIGIIEFLTNCISYLVDRDIKEILEKEEIENIPI